ncbi:putative Major facilitator superfamily (MFS) profile domain-containing protein [Seiridium cardinale]|uniref:Major facilitator superfamily (MFS) profile domain-containing protein n=1 Tax=Seiridium cardinale TaxID=138064 RepID=A0ABR2XI00_9PEZI
MPMDVATWITRLAAESGFTTIKESCRDTKILCLQRFVRMFAYGASFLILVDFLSNKDFSDAQIGLFMTLTLLGDVVISLLLTSITDQVGRRRVLSAGAALMVASGVVFAIIDNYWILLLASVFGVISPTGNEIGPFRAVETSILAQLTEKSNHSDIFAWNILLGTAGAALGAFLSGLIVQFTQSIDGWTKVSAYRFLFLIYAAAGGAKLALSLALSRAVEIPQAKPSDQENNVELREGLLRDDDSDEEPDSDAQPKPKSTTTTPTPPQPSLLGKFLSLFPYISPLSRSILYRLILLFFMDSFASGMATPSWLTYFFTTVHSLEPAILGTLFLVTNVCQTISNLLAVPLARRLGPLKTMVFTHLPSAVFLAMVAIPPASTFGTWLAMAFLALRACTQSLDQAPRQAFLSAAVLPAERTAVMGIVNTIKTLAQSGGIGASGVLAGQGWWVVLFGGAGALKISYDLLMLWMFLHVQDRDEAEA